VVLACGAKTVSDYEVHIVGSGPLDQFLKSEILRLGLNKRIVFHGSVSMEVIKELFQRVDLLVLPSVNRAEAFGVVLLEAISAGLPVIVNNVEGSGMVEVAKSGNFGLVGEYCDPNDWVRCIEFIFDPGNYQRMSQSAKKSFASNYSITSFQNRFSNIVEGL